MSDFFTPHSKHVKISDAGMNVLKNREFTRMVVDAIIKNKDSLDKGEPVSIKGKGQSISLSLSDNIQDAKSKK